jgi:hypothetical protein
MNFLYASFDIFFLLIFFLYVESTLGEGHLKKNYKKVFLSLSPICGCSPPLLTLPLLLTFPSPLTSPLIPSPPICHTPFHTVFTYSYRMEEDCM